MSSDVSTPSRLLGLARLMRLAFAGQDLAPLGERLLARARHHPEEAETLLDLSILLLLRGQREEGLAMQDLAIRTRPLYRLPAVADPPGLRLLVILGPGDLMANTPLEFLLEDSDVELNLLYLLPGQPLPEAVPEHDALFVALAESERSLPLLADLAAWLADWPRPVLNRPERIAHLSRDGVCALLQGAPGVVVPESVRVDRAGLLGLAAGTLPLESLLVGAACPLLIRPVDSHAGHDLAKLDSLDELGAYLAAAPGDAFYLAPFVDYRGRDGLFRKCRLVLVAGQPYVCHFAISAHWMIHYLNAGMAEDAAKRAEEARFMAEFDAGFARRHAAAFAAIHARTGLDYVGIDCAEAPGGELLVFEVDSCMIVHAMDPVDLFPYKQPQMRKVFGAFRSMLEAARHASRAPIRDGA